MTAKAHGTIRRARLAVVLCTAGLLTGGLSANLIGAGADAPAVPGEPVGSPPSQVEPSDSGTPPSEVPPTTTATTPTSTSTTTTTADPPPSDPPATTSTRPDEPAPPRSDHAPAPAPAAAPAPKPSGQPAKAEQDPLPEDDPESALKALALAGLPRTSSDSSIPMGGFAGVAEPVADRCKSAKVKRAIRIAVRTRRRLVAATAPGARADLAALLRTLERISAGCEDPASATTRGRTSAGKRRGSVDGRKEGRARLRNAQGLPTLANPTTSLALPGAVPIGVPNFFIEKFRLPIFLLPIYQAAGIQYGVRWEVLAAINEIETDYGRNLNVSSAGALGWMQFMPATWKAYGVDANRDGRKDPFNPVDAIFAAARYLKAAGADQDLRKAIFAYNHADWYVESVLMRARVIGGLPTDLVGSLSGLTQGHFPVYAKARYADDIAERRATRRVAHGRNVAMPVESDATRRGIDIFAAAGSPVIATQDGRIVSIGRSRRLGRFVRLADAYGNTYTYANLKKIARRVPVPKARAQTKASIARELALPPPEAKPARAATAGRPTRQRPALTAAAASVKPARAIRKERLFAHPARKNARPHGGAQQLLEQESSLDAGKTLKSYFTGAFGLDEKDVVLKSLVPGRRVVAGTILGRVGTSSKKKVSPHMHFEIRPAGRGAPRIDPKPILDGWKLLEATAIYRARGTNALLGRNASVGQVLLMSKEALTRRVLSDPRIEIYSCGRRDIEAGGIDRRALATLAFLAASGMKPSVTSLHCGHSLYTTSGNLSEHSAGSAVDIAKINGIPVQGHQGEGSITDMAIRRLLTLQGTMKPHQIISLMTYDGADNTLAMGDHADHIHVGFQPEYTPGTPSAKELGSVLKPAQWIKLIERLGTIDNPAVRRRPSKYAIPVPVARGSAAHRGE